MAERTQQRRSSDRAYRQTDALLQALSRVEFQYTNGFDPERLFDELLASSLSLTGSGYGFIGEVVTGLNGAASLQVRALINLSMDEVEPVALLDALMMAQQPVVCDLLSDDDASTRRHEIKSAWLLPIHCRGVLVGVVGVADHQKGHNAELVAHLKPFLIMCGILIEALKNDQNLRQAGHVLRESDQRFRIMADTAPVMIWVAGLDKRCTYFNKVWLEFTGRPLEKELGNGWAEGVHSEDYERCLEIYATAFDARREFKMEYRLRRADGEYRWILDHGTPRYLPNGSFVGYIGSCVDITDRREAEEALREGRAFLRQVIDIDPNFIFAKDHDGRFILANQAVADAYGTTVENLIGKTDADFNRDAEEVEFFRRKDLEAMKTLREQFIPEERITDANGKVRWLQTIKRPIIGKDGTAHLLLGSATDITARKQAELDAARQRNELAHLSRVAMLGELSGSLAHELNQPLAAILSNAQAAQRFLAREDADLDEVREILKDIVAEDKRAGEVIHRLRLLLKKGEVQRQPLDVNELAYEVLLLIRSDLVNYGVTVSTGFEPELPTVQGDRVQIQQVLLNLIMNACSAMADDEPADRRLVLRTERAEGGVHIAVSDNGRGIPQQNLDRIFEPFFTTRAEGMGLGLTVCRTIVTAHGGTLRALNNPDRGASMHVILPADPGDAA
ncbi:MAG TPA: PAS domain S-box protein [Nitrospiria bacterium]|nr:PAS domain S-box protein [Nitrospiria bacterium]